MVKTELSDIQKRRMQGNATHTPMQALNRRAPVIAQTDGIGNQGVQAQIDAQLTGECVDVEMADAKEPRIVQAQASRQG
jgi:hypothetical protein